MTPDEKKHFILDIIINTQGKTRFDTSFIASVLGLEVSDVNNLCRELISEDDLKDSSSMDNVGTLTVVCFTQGADSFNMAKYLHLNTIDDIEFEVLNFLNKKSTSTQTRINHILVSSSLTVFETTEALKKMVNAKLIQMNPQPPDLRFKSDNQTIDNHILAFENIHRPIKANITHEGKRYFKELQMEEHKTVNHFNIPDNSGQVQINQPHSSSDLEFNPKYTKHKPDKTNKIATIIGIILTIIGLIIGYLQLIKG